eukprot:TRINITY_DN6911_c0_g1_i4.p1 TRINITY_DN6911_c0_g1~~TRINITY_DN6911_c0_g1_i4.p1  ORF type:complete len:1053 (-),score=180.11 TRINITY_DN6911_c0_g1_i4:446-3577(-)
MEDDAYHVPLEQHDADRWSSSTFTWDLESINTFMEQRDVDALKELGGVKGVSKTLSTDLKKGLKTEHGDYEERVEFYGVNYLPPPPSASWFSLFFEAWKDEAVIILSVAAVVALAAGLTEQFLGIGENGWIDGVAIIVACLIVSTVTATNDYVKDLQFRKLKETTEEKKTVRVIRNGEKTTIPLIELTVGDVVCLHSGDKIPADGLLIPGLDEIQVNESDLTGEPEDLIKDHKDPFLLSGCPVKKGSGTFLVLAVGPHTMWGRTLNEISEEEDTPLQLKLNDLVEKIGYVGMGVASVVFLVLLGWYIKDYVVDPMDIMNCTNNSQAVSVNDSLYSCNISATEGAQSIPHDPNHILVPGKWKASSLVEVLGGFIVAVTIVVVAVPEGLPLAVTISLAYSMKQMLDDQNFVRHLAACEIMGGATNICSDKTGTLTENRMSVVCGWSLGEEWDDTQKLEDILEKESDPEVKELFVNSLCLNVEDGKLEKKVVNGKKVTNFIGSSTECAFLVLAETLGAEPETLQEQHEAVKFYQFNSDRKRMSRAFPIQNGKIRLYVKGAAEMVKGLCTHVLKKDGSTSTLNKTRSETLDGIISTLQAKGLRTLCMAYRDFHSPQQWSKDGSGFEEELTLVSIMGIEDPLRPEVPKAVATCLGAGITVRMVTGDNLLTAKKIATDCGILTEGGIAMEGKEFRELSDEQREELLSDNRLQVLARAIPSDKLVLVKTLRGLGEVVAVTGDGTNDGPALKEADVGMAMGISGTEVAREMADIIILDDNFASIVLAVKWGRCVYDNIRKFLQFQLTVNVVALLVAFIGAVSSYGTPLTAVQLLWVNLIMDTMAALALGTEKPNDTLLWRKPYGRGGKLITATMMRNIIGQAIFQVTVLCTILYAVDPTTGHHLIWKQLPSGKDIDGPSIHYTFLFNTFVFMQVFNEISSRKVNREFNVFSGIFTNWIFVGVIAFTVAAQMIIVELGGVALSTVSLFTSTEWSPYFWLWSVLLGALSLPVGLLLRFIPVPLEHWEVEQKPQEVIEFEARAQGNNKDVVLDL